MPTPEELIKDGPITPKDITPAETFKPLDDPTPPPPETPPETAPKETKDVDPEDKPLSETLKAFEEAKGLKVEDDKESKTTDDNSKRESVPETPKKVEETLSPKQEENFSYSKTTQNPRG